MNMHPCNPLPEIEYKDQSGSVGGVEVGTLDPAMSVCGGATKTPWCVWLWGKYETGQK